MTERPAPGEHQLLRLCKPRTSATGFLYADSEIGVLKAWLRDGRPGPALATATPGSGLTTLVHVLLRELGIEGVWLGCGTPRIRVELDRAGSNCVSVTMRRKAIIVDEFDALASCDSSCAADVLAFARRKPPVVQVLLLAHATRSSKALEFAKAWPRFAFQRPSPATVEAYLLRVLEKHAPSQGDVPPRKEVASLASLVRGDVRAALQALEFWRRGAGGASDGGATGAAAAVAEKDETCDGLDMAEAVLRGERGASVRDCLAMFGADSAVVPMAIYENYLAVVGDQDWDVVVATADAFAEADAVDKYLYSRQSWHLHELYGALAVAAPALILRRRTKSSRSSRSSRSFTISKYGSVWSKAYNACAKVKQARALVTAYAAGGLGGAGPRCATDLAGVRLVLRAALDKDDDEAVRRAVWPLGASDAMALARLGVGSQPSYKVPTRIKKALALASFAA